MSDPRHARARNVFLAARSAPPEGRAEILARECDADPDLRREVEELLRYDSDDDDWSSGDDDWSSGEAPPGSGAELDLVLTVGPGEREAPAGAAPPPDFIHQAVRRLRVVAILLPAAVLTMWLIPVTIGGRLLTDLSIFVQWGPPVLIVVSSLAMLGATRTRLPPTRVLDLGLAYQVVASYGIASSQLWGTFPEVPVDLIDFDVVGYSGVALWMLLFSVLVPTRPRRALPALALSASAPAVTYLLTVRYEGAPSLDAGRFFFTFVFPYFIAVAFAYIGTRVIYGLGRQVGAARELGSYRLQGLLGEGGMGRVWRARHRLLARPAAIKVIRREALGADAGMVEAAVRRFEREAQVTASLRSPHTVELFDFGAAEDGSLYYVMELLDGVDVDRMVERFGPMEPERVVWLARQACLSLAEAHAQGLTHRDIKPANLIVCRLGVEYDVLKVLDFGLVRWGRPESISESSVPGAAAGTPAFMAPEIALGADDVDGRADLYALGCVMYWMLTGRHVFDVPTVARMLAAHVHVEPEPPNRRGAAIPAALETVVLRCLAKSRDDRFGSAEELLAALDSVPLEAPWSSSRAAAWWRDHGLEPVSGRAP